MTMQGDKKNIKPITRYKNLLFFTAGLLALVGGVLIGQDQQGDAPDFTTTAGTQYNWHDLKGQWIVLNYFAPWCAPCLREMPELNQFSQSLPDNTRLFVINYDRTGVNQANALKEKYNIKPEMIISDSVSLLPVKTPPALPATYIIGPQGTLAKTIMGEITEQELNEILSDLQS
ncbi:TlpA family protein disulfide reductase [Salinimonas chungwhensis]|uniref:TlpA family protein disulfide reductase n=1 Tax=Salinimonas chungwhensis TaxID=265425 RepID=UPI00036A0092|nr:TlpA disulfide reductase family protein [Salinimonas chungwhensis]